MKSEKLVDFVDPRIKSTSRRISDRVTGLYFSVLGDPTSKKIYACNLYESSKVVYFDNLRECRTFVETYEKWLKL